MNSPRIRHFTQPPMSVVDRSVSSGNEGMMTMTTTALRVESGRQAGLELVVSRLAIVMLRWSRRRSERREITHEQMQLRRRVEFDRAQAIDFARLNRLG